MEARGIMGESFLCAAQDCDSLAEAAGGRVPPLQGRERVQGTDSFTTNVTRFTPLEIT